MKWLQGAYTQRFNARHHQRGHVFQGRYKALLVEAKNGGYFSTLSTYIHLNPARAGLISKEAGKLSDYRWSSYPLYVKRPSQRPSWLETEHVLADVGIARDDRRGRREYAAYLEKLATGLQVESVRKELEQEWEGIRRGWYLGSEAFRDYLQERLSGLLNGNRRDSYDGGAVCQHDEREARRIMEHVLEALDMRQEDLGRLPKNECRKAVLAWLIRKNTTMTNEWISQQLNMGHISNVTNYVRHVDQATDKSTRQLRQQFANILIT